MLQTLFLGMKDLIYPNCCMVCKNRSEQTKEQNFVCTSCWDKIEMNNPPFCSSCGRHLDAVAIEKNTCLHCLNAKFYFDRAFSPCTYTGIIEKLIHEFKYNGKDYLGKPLGSIMTTFINDYNLPIEHLDFIIPVPLYSSRQREREFNQAQILGQEVAKEFNKELLNNALIRNRPTKTQTGLTQAMRQQNIDKSFSVTRPDLIKNRNFLLVDDVLTTGATSNQAAKSLKEAGAKIVLLMTLAS